MDHQSQQTPAPSAQLEAEFYEVQAILDKRLTSNGLMYLIKWKGYPEEKNFTWEPVQHLTQVEDLVKEFNLQYKGSKNKEVKAKPKQPSSKSTKKPEKVKKQIKVSKAIKGIQSSSEQEELPTNKRTYRKLNRTMDKKSSSQAEQSNEQAKDQQYARIHTNTQKESRVEKSKPYAPLAKDKPYEQDILGKGYSFGSITCYFYQHQQFYFKVNIIDAEERVCSTKILTEEDTMKHHQLQLYEFCQNWCENYLIEQRRQKNSSEFRDFWANIE